MKKIKKVLVANRGEIAIRIFRACAELGIGSIGIFSYEDRFSLHRYKADESYLTGEGQPPVQAYLDIEGIIKLARLHRADAIHPGYGFLSENPDFARRCEENGIIFIGPDSRLIEKMGNKIHAKKCASEAGLSLIPGTEKGLTDLQEARKKARKIGFPLIVKASFGGGGRGMRTVPRLEEFDDLFLQAHREAVSAFGKGELFLEKYIVDSKHIEVQILADNHGQVVHLYERDCSIQRRHQKVVEIAPCLNIPPKVRERLCNDAVTLASHIGYKNAGTVEFLVDRDWNPYFIEMNPRIQVEHTVTEMITGLDIVKSQLRVAEGYRLNSRQIGISQGSISERGFAFQCRVTTEDARNNFIPDHGRIEIYQSPASFGVRLDAGSAYPGAIITPFYDSLLVKLTIWSIDFEDAVHKALRALREFRIRGVETNLPFLENVINHPKFLEGGCSTSFIDEHPELFRFSEQRDKAYHLLKYISEVIINGNPMVKHRETNRVFRKTKLPECDLTVPPAKGTKQLLEEMGAEKFSRWIKEKKRLLITDTTFRDAHQSLLATRVRSYDLLKIADSYSRMNPEIFSVEMWGGATFDTSLRFLKECPWERLVKLREKIPNLLFQMLLRGSNAVGYTAYPDKVIKEFIRESAQAGIDVFRIFDSLNWLENMRISIEEVIKSGKLAEVAICYTGDILDSRRDKYNLKYYVTLAKEIEKMGAHILAIKDMAGLCKPYAIEKLVKTLKGEIGIPLHFHTHATSGVQAAAILKAAEAEVDIVDCAIASMSGLTSQPNLNSIVSTLENTPRNTGLGQDNLNKFSDYWARMRECYYPFESGLLYGTAEIYKHEIPGGQYSNLWPQAKEMGLGDRWEELLSMYEAVNKQMGDIIKVTPSSKVVGDMALYLLTNNIKEDEILEKASEIDFPQSVVDFFLGKLGQPYQGFPRELQAAVLKGRTPLTDRPGKSIPDIDLDQQKTEMERKLRHQLDKRNVLSSILYPQ
ncbi:MAG: pyruvate carboxylase, partial [bacterium]